MFINVSYIEYIQGYLTNISKEFSSSFLRGSDTVWMSGQGPRKSSEMLSLDGYWQAV